MRWLGGVVAAMVAMGLGGCALVASDKPWFGPEDARSAPVLRQGFWVNVGDDDCRARADRPIRLWRNCVIVLVRDGEYLGLGEDEQRWVWRPLSVLLAAGDPPILQLYGSDEPEGVAPYSYAGVELAGFDSEGRVTLLRLWAIGCEQDVPYDDTGRRPLWPGLTPRDAGGYCDAESREGLFVAARASKPSKAQMDGVWRWVREPRPDDFAGGGR